MKTLAASDADVIEDFWTRDLSDLYETYQLHWERRERNAPDVRGLETLTLSMLSAFPGRRFVLPSSDIRAEYTMSTPSKRQGARAVDLQGVVSVVGVGNVWLDLKARMERVDVPGVTFEERVRGLFALGTSKRLSGEGVGLLPVGDHRHAVHEDPAHAR